MSLYLRHLRFKAESRDENMALESRRTPLVQQTDGGGAGSNEHSQIANIVRGWLEYVQEGDEQRVLDDLIAKVSSRAFP